MTIDETIRAFAYFLMFPAYTYFALIAWNRQQRLVSLSYALMSAFFCMLLVSVVCNSHGVFVPSLRYLNTGIVAALAGAVTYRAAMTLVDALYWRVDSFYLIEEELHD